MSPAEESSAYPLASPAPKVELVNAFAEPFANAVAAARTCYSSHLVTPAEVQEDERARARRDAIAKSTYEAGHHTVLQHAHFQFAIANVSRQLLWSFLHAHPFYNSEQVSQRYVAVEPDRVLVPVLAGRAADLYRDTIAAQMTCYRELCDLLLEPAARAYFEIFPARARQREVYAGAIRKKAQEAARYCLPVATFAHLYHTVSGLTLHRYYRLCGMLDVPTETRLVVGAMIDAVRRHDPLFFSSLEDPIALEETHEHRLLAATRTAPNAASARAFRDEFDRELDGRASRLCDFKPNGEHLLARAVRSVAGLPSSALADEEAIAWALSPARNPYRAGPLSLTSLGKLGRALVHPHYTFQKKLSHSADSQDQRHRLTPGSRPILAAHYVGGEPDVILPALMAASPAARDRFLHTMRATWSAIDALLDGGVDQEWALYLLPNAFPIRFEESGDLTGFAHKWTTRLCYTAQEEIWRASVEEVQQLRAVHPRIGVHLGPPCVLRQAAGRRPLCPEGTRYCGVPVWKLALDDYHRVV